ncbi:MAG: PilX N-terminal domain-containing pilus assembly protein [Candidatus Eisenbacteria bacterium]
MSKTPHHLDNENGIALVVAMLVLLVLTLLGIVLMASAVVNRKVAGHDLRTTNALNVAEAGVSEAMGQLRANSSLLNVANPRATAQIFLAVPGNVPALGTDSVGVATGQPAGAWLNYSTPTRSPDALTVRFKTGANRTVIYKYDATRNPKINTATGVPIYEVAVTGTVGSARRSVVAEVIQKPFFANCLAALTADVNIGFVGNAVVCGFNHSADTPYPAGENGRVGTNPCLPYESGAGLPGSWSSGTTTNGGAATRTGNPAYVDNQTGFYPGPWSMLNMTQADFVSWLGGPSTSVPGSLYGITYLDNNTTISDQSGSFGIHGAVGEGMLYVDGDLTLNSTFTYRGIVYVEGDLKINGTAWILGGLVVRGKTDVTQNGGSTILYSNDAITRALSQYGGQFVTLSWREVDR